MDKGGRPWRIKRQILSGKWKTIETTLSGWVRSSLLTDKSRSSLKAGAATGLCGAFCRRTVLRGRTLGQATVAVTHRIFSGSNPYRSAFRRPEPDGRRNRRVCDTGGPSSRPDRHAHSRNMQGGCQVCCSGLACGVNGSNGVFAVKAFEGMGGTEFLVEGRPFGLAPSRTPGDQFLITHRVRI